MRFDGRRRTISTQMIIRIEPELKDKVTRFARTGQVMRIVLDTHVGIGEITEVCS